MLKNIIVITVLSLLVISCNETVTKKKPDNLLSKEKMSDILYDLYVINSAKGVSRKLLEVNGIIPENYILGKHNIDSMQFATSNNYYAFNPDEYKLITDKVKERLESKKEEYEALKEVEDQEEKKKQDSIRKASQKSQREKEKEKEAFKLKRDSLLEASKKRKDTI